MTTPRNYPRDELIRMADEALAGTNGKGVVFFKYTCRKCGERVQFDDPNTMYEEGECPCGEVQPFVEGGFSLEISLEQS